MAVKRYKKDNIHYSPCRIDGHNKSFNFIISEREAGKTTSVIAWKMYKSFFHNHRPCIVLRRMAVDITETYISDLQNTTNDFLPKSRRVKFDFKKGSIRDGIVDVTVNGRPYCRFIAMSCPKSRIKSLRYDNPGYMFIDEFIVDNRHGERYLSDESLRFREIYNTFNRFATRNGRVLKCYFCGNPYSVYNPYFVWLNVDLAKIRPGAFIVGKNYAIECYQISDELREFIRTQNPLYDFDDAYTRYAFNGESINDSNITVVSRQPDGYKLRYVFRLNDKYLYVYYMAQNRDRTSTDYGKYWIRDADKYVGSHDVFAVDFNNLVDGTRLATTEIRMITYRLKQCIGNRDVTYSSINAGYLTEQIYNIL